MTGMLKLNLKKFLTSAPSSNNCAKSVFHAETVYKKWSIRNTGEILAPVISNPKYAPV